MEDSEIVKALECCANCESCDYETSNCPLNEEMECRSLLAKSALDLINRLQAQNDELFETVDYRMEQILKLENNLKTAKAEAYKEFAELLCKIWQRYEEENISSIYVPKWVMRVYEELVGEDK